MAKRKVNKSEVIRNALAANPDKKPKEIVALLAEQGIKVGAAFVSIVKSKTKQQGRKTKRVAKRRSVGNLSPVTAAVEFIKAAGGIAEAKAALAQIEEIRRL